MTVQSEDPSKTKSSAASDNLSFERLFDESDVKDFEIQLMNVFEV